MNLVVECGGVRKADRAVKGDRVATVYVSGIRPMETGGGILEDFAWRRNHAAPVPPKAMLDFLAPILYKKHFVTVRKISYDRKAGCGCGCSPGYKLWGDIDRTAREVAGMKYEDPNWLGGYRSTLDYWVTTPEYVREQEAKICAQSAAGGW